MPFLVAHRGNIDGPSENENHPDHIRAAIRNDFYVEVDIWRVNLEYYLGHDYPKYKVDDGFINQRHLIFHTKNIEALWDLVRWGYHCFWHKDDDYALTSQGYIWTTHEIFNSRTIHMAQKQELFPNAYLWSAGICSDYVLKIRSENG
jgi:hypothetical protein